MAIKLNKKIKVVTTWEEHLDKRYGKIGSKKEPNLN